MTGLGQGITYIPQESKVIYRSKHDKNEKDFDALEWPRQKAAGCPGNGMQAQANAAMHARRSCAKTGSPMSQIRESPPEAEFAVELVRLWRRYYSNVSNVSRDKRKKRYQDGLIPNILEPIEDPGFSGDESPEQYRKNWARLIQKIYPVKSLKGVA